MSIKWGQICGDVTTSPKSSVLLAILNREQGSLWVNIVLWDTLVSCRTNPFLKDQRLINSEGWEKGPWKFLVWAVLWPLPWNAWEQGAWAPPGYWGVLSEAPGLNCFCVHCFNDKQSPNLTLSKSQSYSWLISHSLEGKYLWTTSILQGRLIW